MGICKNHLSSIYARLRAKSSSSCSDYKVTAVAYSKKGNILGYSSNNIRSDFIPVRRGAGVHAEITLIKKFGKRISYIVISRFGLSGNPLPIDPCENCAKVASQLGIKILRMRDFIQESKF